MCSKESSGCVKPLRFWNSVSAAYSSSLWLIQQIKEHNIQSGSSPRVSSRENYLENNYLKLLVGNSLTMSKILKRKA